MTTCLEKLFIRFNVRVFRERLSICACASVPFVFEGGVSDLIALVPVIVFEGHSLSSQFCPFNLLITAASF